MHKYNSLEEVEEYELSKYFISSSSIVSLNIFNDSNPLYFEVIATDFKLFCIKVLLKPIRLVRLISVWCR